MQRKMMLQIDAELVRCHPPPFMSIIASAVESSREGERGRQGLAAPELVIGFSFLCGWMERARVKG